MGLAMLRGGFIAELTGCACVQHRAALVSSCIGHPCRPSSYQHLTTYKKKKKKINSLPLVIQIVIFSLPTKVILKSKTD